MNCITKEMQNSGRYVIDLHTENELNDATLKELMNW